MAFDRAILGKALGEPRLLDADEIRQLAQWAERQESDADRLAHDLRNSPERTKRVQWVAGFICGGTIVLAFAGALTAYILTDTPAPPKDAEQMRQQACEAYEDVDTVKSRLHDMCYQD